MTRLTEKMTSVGPVLQKLRPTNTGSLRLNVEQKTIIILVEHNVFTARVAKCNVLLLNKNFKKDNTVIPPWVFQLVFGRLYD